MSDGPSLERRSFLRAFGAAALVRPLESALAPLASADEPLSALADFEPIPASHDDDLVLPPGFTYDVVIKWGDAFTASGERFGFNNDFIGVFALSSGDDALLWINHEYVSLATTNGNVDLYGPDLPHAARPRSDRARLPARRRGIGGARAQGRGQRGPGLRSSATAASTPSLLVAWTAQRRPSCAAASSRGRSRTARAG